jgi:hypothetical protein
VSRTLCPPWRGVQFRIHSWSHFFALRAHAQMRGGLEIPPPHRAMEPVAGEHSSCSRTSWDLEAQPAYRVRNSRLATKHPS